MLSSITSRKSMEATDLLPLELWREIALTDCSTWCVVSLTVPGVYNDADRDRLKTKDVTVTTETTEGVTITRKYLRGVLHNHRGEGPAVLCSDGSYEYRRMGQLHRNHLEGPAMYCRRGWGTSTFYYEDGIPHRHPLIGPAITYCDGSTQYRWMGLLHRDEDEGPADVDLDCGETTYYWNGRMHRDPKKGPAYYTDGGCEMYCWHGDYHRDPKDGPALVPGRGGLTAVLEEAYYVFGGRVEPPPR